MRLFTEHISENEIRHSYWVSFLFWAAQRLQHHAEVIANATWDQPISRRW